MNQGYCGYVFKLFHEEDIFADKKHPGMGFMYEEEDESCKLQSGQIISIADLVKQAWSLYLKQSNYSNLENNWTFRFVIPAYC